MHKTLLLNIIVLLMALSCQYKPVGDRLPGAKLRVLSTTGIIGDMVNAIGQDRIIQDVLMGPGVDPHLYKASQRDVYKLSRANLIFYNGLHLEGKMAEILHKLGSHKPVVALSDGIAPGRLRAVEGFGSTYDPHIWFDVLLWRDAALHVGQALAQHDSANAAFYLANTKAYCTQLDSLNNWIIKEWAQIKPDQRVLVTAHDAFGYYGRAYQVEVRGLQGISTQAEFGLQDVTGLVNFIVARKLNAIFVETSVPAKAIEAVVAGCKSKGWTVHLAPPLYSDALGAKDTPEGTYIGMVKTNTMTIINGLKQTNIMANQRSELTTKPQ